MTEEQLDNLKQEYLQTLRAFARNHTIYLEQDGQELTYYIFDPKEKDPFVPVTGYTENDEQMKSVTEYLNEKLFILDNQKLTDARKEVKYVDDLVFHYQSMHGTIYAKTNTWFTEEEQGDDKEALVFQEIDTETRTMTTYDENWNKEMYLNKVPVLEYWYINKNSKSTFPVSFHRLSDPDLNSYLANQYPVRDGFALYADTIKAAHDKFGKVYVSTPYLDEKNYDVINFLGEEPQSVYTTNSRSEEYKALGATLFTTFDIKEWNFEEQLPAILDEIDSYRDPGNKEIWSDPHKVTQMVNEYGSGKLRHASDELRSNEDFVLSLVEDRCFALKYAADSLRDDEDFCSTRLS